MTRKMQSVRISSVLLSFALLSACATAPYQYPHIDIQSLSAVELTATPFHPQEEFQCGPAALATVLQVAGVSDIAPDDLTPQVYIPGREGSLQTELLAATRRAERIPFVIPRQLEALFTEVDAGYPVLVLQNLGFSRFPIWHYAVVIGVDPSQQNVILRSGTTEREVMSFAKFERSWRLGQYWGMVVPPVGQTPRTLSALDYYAAVTAVEQQGRRELAAQGYTAGIKRWPNEAIGYLGLGGLAYQQGDYADAEEHFYRVTELQPRQAAGFFNLAWAFQRQGKYQEALDAARVAAQLAPEHPRYSQAEVLIAKDQQN